MRNLVRSASLGMCLCAAASSVGSAALQAEAPPARTYLVVYKQGPAWPGGDPMNHPALKEHGRYILGLHVKGSLKLAGPFLDVTGGAAAFQAADDEAAKAVVAADPAVTSGIFVAEVHSWRLVDWAALAKR